jgi:DNA-binding MarR family transcriptional regulator
MAKTKPVPARLPRRDADAKERGDPASPEFQIEEWPFYLIARTAGRYAIDMEKALQRLQLDLASWRALMLVHERNPSSVSEIAERAVTRLSTMTRVIQRLQKRQLVRLSRRTGDARVTEVHITGSGERMVAEVRALASHIYSVAFRDLDAADVETLNSLLRRVHGNLAIL